MAAGMLEGKVRRLKVVGVPPSFHTLTQGYVFVK